jgi:hypothetical protein
MKAPPAAIVALVWAIVGPPLRARDAAGSLSM